MADGTKSGNSTPTRTLEDAASNLIQNLDEETSSNDMNERGHMAQDGAEIDERVGIKGDSNVGADSTVGAGPMNNRGGA